MSILNIFNRQRIGPEVKILVPGERMNQRVLCPHCEKDMEGHDALACARKGVSRRVFFGIFGASAAALALRIEGIPLPSAKVQVRAFAGDMFEVETLNPFTLAWGVAKDKPFKDDHGALSTGGILEFHGQDVARPDKWLRVHRGLPEMEVLGLVDKVTGSPVKYRIIRSEEADKRVGLAEKRVMQEHYAAARAVRRDLIHPLMTDPRWNDVAEFRKSEELTRRNDRARAIEAKFGGWNRHASVNRLAWGRPLPRPKGTLPA